MNQVMAITEQIVTMTNVASQISSISQAQQVQNNGYACQAAFQSAMDSIASLCKKQTEILNNPPAENAEASVN
jgi:hypothetical protein